MQYRSTIGDNIRRYDDDADEQSLVVEDKERPAGRRGTPSSPHRKGTRLESVGRLNNLQ